MNDKKIQRETKKRINPKSGRVSNDEFVVDEKRRKQMEAVEKALKSGASIHDSYFHFMLRDPVFLADFLGAYLPDSVLEALDLSDPGKIRFLSTDFYDERGAKHIADLIFSVPCKDENDFVLLKLLVEHKAQSGASIDHKTISQTARYVVLEVDGELKDVQKDVESVYQPLVVLFYTGSDPDFEVPSWESTFPLPSSLQVGELKDSQIRYKPITVNLTRRFLEGKISKNGFLNVMVASMALAGLKRLPEHYSTLFSALGQIENWTDADVERLKASINYVVSATNRPMTNKEVESLRLGINNEGVEKKMKTILDVLEDRGKRAGRREGRREGEIKGEIKTIKTVASLRFQETSDRLPQLLPKLNDLKLLNQACQFTLTAPSLLDVENFVENLIPVKPKGKRVAKRQTA